MNDKPESIDTFTTTLTTTDLARVSGGVSLKTIRKVGGALRDGIAQLWTGDKLPEIKRPGPRPPTEIIDSRPAPTRPKIPGVKLPYDD